MSRLELIDGLIEQLNTLQYSAESHLDAIRRRAKMIIRNCFGEDSEYIQDVEKIHFYLPIAPAPEEYKREAWQSGARELLNLFNTMKEEVLLFDGSFEGPQEHRTRGGPSNRIFIVHGHDESMKLAVARTLDKLNLETVILHEKPSMGRTIIEKFTEYSDVSFAIVLLSPDDIGYARTARPEEAKYRARQNVILELGYFLGKLGRTHVVALHREEDGFEMPSDYSGVMFVRYDAAGRWQLDLVQELKACGYSVDANRLLD